ncbi:MAG: NAD(P)-dependent oxidoreductase [Acidobacteria bacterium]|nr:NAD(P)-dependent oxidoreductase [Acidobacteriota bacterium]
MAQISRKQRIKIPSQPLRKQDPVERRHNWDEVFLGYTPETAIVEANRCLQCEHAPCIQACPVHNAIPEALALLEDGDFIGAANKFRETSSMPEICGRICPQEKLCEGACVVGHKEKPVAIGKLEAFCTDYQRRTQGFPVPWVPLPTGQKVAIVGAGPAGLEVAERLVQKGHAVTVFDYWPRPGGLLLYGIPNFKLTKEIVDAKIALLEGLGVRFVCNVKVGEHITVDGLFQEGFDAVFLGHGAPMGNPMKIPGEDLKGVYQATDFLVRGNLPMEDLPEGMRSRPKVGDRIAVIGAGDTAMDCVRTASRLNPNALVRCVYRRTEAEVVGREEERIHAKEEGVQFEFLTLPVRFVGDHDGTLRGLECVRMGLGERDASGRRSPVPIPGSEFTMEVDTAVLAIGYSPDPLIGESTPGLRTRKKGLIYVETEETGRTTREGVFAGGDNVRGADLVVTALAAARNAAEAIHAYLVQKKCQGNGQCC